MNAPISNQDTLDAEQAQLLIRAMASAARNSQAQIGQSSVVQRNQALQHAAQLIGANHDEILSANHEDVERGKKAGLSDAFIDRLTLTSERINAMANGGDAIGALAASVGVAFAG